MQLCGYAVTFRFRPRKRLKILVAGVMIYGEDFRQWTETA